MDMPKMLPQQKHEYPFEVSIPVELEPFVTDYAISAQTGAAAKYDSPKIAAQIWRPKVRSKYPEMFKTIDQYGKEVKFDDEKTILPIPQREIDLNASLKQNAGY